MVCDYLVQDMPCKALCPRSFKHSLRFLEITYKIIVKTIAFFPLQPCHSCPRPHPRRQRLRTTRTWFLRHPYVNIPLDFILKFERRAHVCANPPIFIQGASEHTIPLPPRQTIAPDPGVQLRMGLCPPHVLLVLSIQLYRAPLFRFALHPLRHVCLCASEVQSRGAE